jgi:hypothetical protein
MFKFYSHLGRNSASCILAWHCNAGWKMDCSMKICDKSVRN